MRGVLAVLVLVGGLALGGVWWLKGDGKGPQASLTAPLTALGRQTPIDVDVHVDGPGLRQVSARLVAGGNSYDLASESYPASSWRGSLVNDQRVHIAPDLGELKVPEGQATLEIYADTYGWHLLPRSTAPILSVPLTVDLSPPLVAPQTTQHNARLGGVELAIWRQSPDTVESHIEIDRYTFPSVSGYFADPALALALFAIPQDLDVTAQPRIVARDAAGNRREVNLPVSIKPRQFAERTLPIDDAFLSRKVPELEQINHLPTSTNPVEGYLHINRELRKQNEARIKEVTQKSAPRPLWEGAFHRQTNAAPLSSFADRRTYTYKGEVIDHQTHLGFDLASLRLAPVESAQDGVVVFAGNLGIYGNTVIVDHGLGMFSLYGHLSSIAVRDGETVRVKQTLGQTGETGLAGGDHLHFSIMLHGTHVDPVEWWDGHWIRDHVTGKLAMFPHATVKTDDSHEQSQPRDAAQPR